MQHDYIQKIKFLTLAPQSPTHEAWPRRPNEDPVWYVLHLLFVRRHTKFGLKIFVIEM